MQLMDEKTVWNEGDLVSVFYKSNANQQWKFNGVTGDRIGELSQVEPGVASAPMEKVVVVYPYNANYLITPSTGAVETTLPAEQSYLENSYGIGSSMLIASGYYTQFTFKNVMGWLKLQLTGEGEKVTKVVFRGNNGEQVAGNVYVNADDASLVLSSAEADEGEEGSVNGNLNFENSVVTELTLNCENVTLGAEATSFYLALPPQVFEKGFTVDIWALDAEENELKMTAKSEGLLAIERNAIQPLEAIAYQGKPTTLYATTFNTVTNFMTPAMHGMANTYYLMVENPETGDNAGLVFYDNSDPFMALYGQYTVVEGSMGMTTPDTPSLIADWSYSNFTIDGNIYYPLRGTITVDTTMAMLGTDDANALTFDLVVVDEDYNEVSLVGYCEFGPFGYGPSYIDINLNTWGFTNFVVSYDETDSNLVTLKSSSITNGDLVLNLTTENGEVAGVYDVNDNNLAGYYFDSLDAVDYNITSGRIEITKVEDSENEWELFISYRAGDWVFGDKYKVAVPEQTATYIVTLEFPEPEVIGIATAADLVAFAAAVNAGDYSAWVDPADGEVNVLADIDMTGVAWTPIASFDGVFDGNKYAIKNWTTSRGLFVNNAGTVKNVVIDATCALAFEVNTVEAKDPGLNLPRAFVVESNNYPGVVSSCENKGSVAITGYVANTSSVSYTYCRVGGVVGESMGTIDNCINRGSITAASTTKIDKVQNIGGVVGYLSPNDGAGITGEGVYILKDCYNYGDININLNCKPYDMCLGGVVGGTKPTALGEGNADSPFVYPTLLGTIKDCHNEGAIYYTFTTLSNGTYGNIGGVIGYSGANVVGCTNKGAVSFILSTADTAVAASRPAVGGVVGTSLFSITDCVNYGTVTAKGVWRRGTKGATRAGATRESSFGGVVACVGLDTDMDNTSTVSGCENRGKVTINEYVMDGQDLQANIGGVIGYSTVAVSNCHNYAELDFNTKVPETWIGGVLGRGNGASITNCSNNGYTKITIMDAVVKNDKSQRLGGVVGQAYSVDNCQTNAKVDFAVNAYTMRVKVVYAGGIAGYSNVGVTNSTLDAAVALNVVPNLTAKADNINSGDAGVRLAGIVAQVGAVAGTQTVTNCSTTKTSSVTLTTNNTLENMVGGIVARGNNGIASCTNNATVTLNVPTANAGTNICYVAGVACCQKESMTGCTNNGAVVANMGGSTCPLYAAGVLADNYAATSTVSGSTNSANVTVTNYSGTAGVYGGVVAHSAAGATVAADCTSTGTVTVNGTAQ